MLIPHRSIMLSRMLLSRQTLVICSPVPMSPRVLQLGDLAASLMSTAVALPIPMTTVLVLARVSM